MNVAAAIQSIRQAGFVIGIENDSLAVDPFSKLNETQLKFLRENKQGIIAVLSATVMDRHAAEKEAAELLRIASDDELEALSVTEEPKPLSEEEVSQLLDRAITGLNLSRSQLRAKLSDDDMAGIRCGDIKFETLRAYSEIWAKREPMPVDDGRDIRTDRKQVTCGACEHFRPDTIGDGTGIGTCSSNAWKPGRGPCLYPRAKRFCEEFKQGQSGVREAQSMDGFLTFER